MSGKRILFISGSLGLGHVCRDLVIARELRKNNPNMEIDWLAAHPATEFLENAGEKMAPGVGRYANDNIPAEKAASKGSLNLLRYLNNAKKEWGQSVKVFEEITTKKPYDLAIGDETYEIMVAIGKKPSLKKTPFVMIYDFIGLDAMTKNPFEKLGIYIWNRVWANVDKRRPVADLSLFIGEEADIPDRPFDFFLPNRRQWAKQRCEFVGYVLSFDPSSYTDIASIRKDLGYSQDPLIISSVGGSAVGKPLLELFGRTYPLLADKLPGLRMLLVCGPRINIASIDIPEGAEIVGYIPDLYQHYASCDLAMIMGGGSSTLELTALKRPFIYFPLEEHCEQVLNVAARVERHRAGVRMIYSRTTPELLAKEVLENIGKEVDYAEVPTKGGQKAANLISRLL